MDQKIKTWRAYYVKPRHEKKASERLEERGYRIYCPLVKTRVRWSDRWKSVIKPLVPGYIFACVDESERTELLQDRSVFRCVHWLGRPAEIREDEIEAMKLLIEGGTDIKVEPFEPGTKVRVEQGALRGKSGTIIYNNETEATLRGGGGAVYSRQ